MVTLNYGAVKYKSIRAAAEAVASKTGEPVSRVYIRMWKRIETGNKVWSKPRKYVKQVSIN